MLTNISQTKEDKRNELTQQLHVIQVKNYYLYNIYTYIIQKYFYRIAFLSLTLLWPGMLLKQNSSLPLFPGGIKIPGLP